MSARIFTTLRVSYVGEILDSLLTTLLYVRSASVMILKKCPKRSISRENKGGGQTLFGKIPLESSNSNLEGFPNMDMAPGKPVRL